MTDVEPLLVSVKDAARILGVSTDQVYKLLDQLDIDCKYIGTKRLVIYASLKKYVAGLPDEHPSERAS